jgi:3'-5' exoribonuclease
MPIVTDPSAAAPTVRSVLVRDLTDGMEVDQVLLVRAAEMRTKADGAPYLRLTLGDRTGAAVAMVWDDVPRLREVCTQGTPLHVRASYERHPKYGPQFRLRGLGPAQPGTYDLADLLDGPPRSAAAMESDLRELIATIQDEHLRALLDRVLGPQTQTWALYRRAPAAKHYHQAYEHGLLEHSLSVAQAVSATSATFPGIDRDVAVTGALLHDIGKLEAYTTDPAAIDLTDAGRLQGEIPLGYYRIRREIEDIPGFPPALAQAVGHIILSHHGSLEHGSPVVPATREATLVHMIDNLGGRLGSFDRLEKELPPGAVWSSFDRAIGGGAYFGTQSQDAPGRAAAA